MVCPTCEYKMAELTELQMGPSRYWCPRCGTTNTNGWESTTEVPLLVSRSKLLAEAVGVIPKRKFEGQRDPVGWIPQRLVDVEICCSPPPAPESAAEATRPAANSSRHWSR